MAMQMINRTQRYIERFCPSELLAGECAEKIFGAKKLGKNWKEIRQSIVIGEKMKRIKVNSFIAE